MATYVRAGLPEVATALAALTGEDHPLVPRGAVPQGADPGAAPMTMRRTDNGTGPAPPQAQRVPADQLLPDLALYERLIDEGVAARSRPRQPGRPRHRPAAGDLAGRPAAGTPFAQGLARFINTGVIHRELMTRLRIHARSATYADQPEAARLMQYCTARGTDLGPVADNFGAACHQMDRADLMLADLRDRNRHGTSAAPDRPRPIPADPLITVLARHDPDSQITTLVLDSVTADVAIYAIAAHAEEREAHLRQVQLTARTCPKAPTAEPTARLIADRETRISRPPARRRTRIPRRDRTRHRAHAARARWSTPRTCAGQQQGDRA